MALWKVVDMVKKRANQIKPLPFRVPKCLSGTVYGSVRPSVSLLWIQDYVSIAYYICLFPGLCTIVFLISNTAWTVAWGLCTANCGWCQVYDITIADYSFKWQLVTDVGLTSEFTAALPHGLEWEGHFVWFSHHRLLLIPLLLPQTSSFPTGLSAVKKPQHCAFKMALPVIMFLCRQRYSRWKIAIITPVEIFPFNTVKLQLTHLDSN